MASPRASSAGRATDKPGDSSPLALGLLLRRAHDRAATALANGAVRPLGLELRHFAVLITLSENGPQNQRDLAAETGTDKATMVRVIDDLENRGLVVRRSVPGDRRLREVEMTPHGMEVFDQAHVPAVGIARQLTSHLAPGESEQLLDLLTRFTYPPDAE